MHLTIESLLIILLVGLVAGWLAGQIVKALVLGSSVTSSSVSSAPIWAVGCFRSSASTSASEFCRRSLTRPSARCYCCWQSGLCAAEADRDGVGEEVGADVGSAALGSGMPGLGVRACRALLTCAARCDIPRRSQTSTLGGTNTDRPTMRALYSRLRRPLIWRPAPAVDSPSRCKVRRSLGRLSRPFLVAPPSFSHLAMELLLGSCKRLR